MLVIRYFAGLRMPKLVLWCYLVWYLAVSACYFDPSPVIWLTAAGMSVLIGIALVFATQVPGQGTDRWTVFRLFLFPFCVSSYSALIKGKGFFVIFPTEPWPLLTGVAACAVIVAGWLACRWTVGGKEKGKSPDRDPGIA
ncbi:hypothetical protein OKA05_25275 [Luteolibacter arcticus]|uniref:Uncharacterized protein n=1 Tax=Luteolibacter arcticus TaxID=1581411 RepID=A0ABT3GQU1_9BACT|nr:hypothetical protein [Luteolibacter arcticus]MCW1925896.1 hypothetical protein [Luteolibacter arcticus]